MGAIIKQVLSNIAGLKSYKELILILAMREIKIRYKQTFLGVVWAILQPLSMMVILTIVFSYFTQIPTRGIPYPIFSYSALLPWTFFATSLSFATASILSNKDLVSKIYLPREIFPLSSVIAALVDFSIASTVFMGLMIYYGVPLNKYFILLPLIILLQILLTLGLSLLLAAVNVFYRDVRYIIPLGIQLWMFISPVIYPVEMVPKKFLFLYMLNPMAGIISAYRSIALYAEMPTAPALTSALALSTMLFIIGYRVFKKLEKQFADII